MSSPILEDLEYIYKDLGNTKKFKNKNILITGCGGLIGFYLILFLKKYKKKLGIKKIVGVDNIQYKSSDWINQIYNQKDIIFYNHHREQHQAACHRQTQNPHLFLLKSLPLF